MSLTDTKSYHEEKICLGRDDHNGIINARNFEDNKSYASQVNLQVFAGYTCWNWVYSASAAGKAISEKQIPVARNFSLWNGFSFSNQNGKVVFAKA